ncbi:MAG TPA: hypothetical protein VGM25_06160 [Caulobacteraceae bacterium]
MKAPATLALAALLLAACDRPAPPGVALQRNGSVEARGVDGLTLGRLRALPPDAQDWTRVLSVSVSPGLPAVLGRYAVQGAAVTFQPAYPLQPGRPYLARLDPGGGRPVLTARLTPAAAQAQAPVQVVAVYPSGATQPQNLLRLYLQFSAPMAAGRQGTVQLLDGHGRAVEDAFLPLGYEFWSPDRTRLTLLVDPGRVKREILQGTVLRQGEAYTLVVGRDWTDAHGAPLGAEYRKPLTIGPPERRPLDPRAWSLTAPPLGSRQPLTVAFGRPLDRAVMLSGLGVEDAEGRALQGRAAIPPGEASWSFTPDEAWREGPYRFVAQPWLEDPQGNRPHAAFEQASRTPAPKTPIVLPFRPRA